MELRQIFAVNIKRLRKERGLSQEGLAFESGLHRTYISGIERGIRNVSLDNIGVLAGALGVEPAQTLQPFTDLSAKTARSGNKS